MIIDLNKFGITLVSRPAGKEAWLAYQPILKSVPKDEKITVNFNGVVVLTPSWADEFLTPLRKRFKTVELIDTSNPSVRETLDILSKNT
jgi:hypothetical protein